ncbi:ABC transporter substrate-binding protein [Siculibacillus lacustris]|uniref:ABC transporter substrate-binding protein n=1 Tax=Siculibacillus lacustris TaxID=1549641 RepID=A0A4Q9VKR0_9HYPH|nr:ABC transporter substrate-binding protein [Siculibacillus lacustris]TBW35532.1 ABC transporter substrate-binding protein [Siculibacillus lacustris]
MNTILKQAPSGETIGAGDAAAVLYTICPVLNGSAAAAELGWLDEEFARVGAKATYLRSLPENEGWLPHYNHGKTRLFRDGGAIPTIQAKADRIDTTLIGLTWGQTGGSILVRADSGIRRVADLKGRRIGLIKSLNRGKIDFQRATAEFGIELALHLAGLSRADVEIVDLEHTDQQQHPPAAKPSQVWARARSLFGHKAADVAGLEAGVVDAIHSDAARAFGLIASGRFTAIEDLSRHPDWTLQISNGPYTAAVDTEFAVANRDVVVAFLRAAIRGGRWAKENPRAAAPIYRRATFFDDLEQIEKHIAAADLIPNLSRRNRAAIEIQKSFLISHGYQTNDFAVDDWANGDYLAEALESLR